MGTPRFTPEFKEEAVRQISSITLKCSTTGPGATVISAASVRGLRTGLVVRTGFVYRRGVRPT
jgi:hypothetical protein